jgi:hypothetical protein
MNVVIGIPAGSPYKEFLVHVRIVLWTDVRIVLWTDVHSVRWVYLKDTAKLHVFL